jgi:hypothetical protein
LPPNVLLYVLACFSYFVNFTHKLKYIIAFDKNNNM